MKRFALICFIICSVLPVFPCHAQDWYALRDSTHFYIEKMNYRMAQAWGEQAIHFAGKVFGKRDTLYAISANDLAEIHNYNGQYEKAFSYSQEAVDIWQITAGKANINFAMALQQLADSYQNMGQYKEAEVLQRQVVEITKKLVGEHDPIYAISLNYLALAARRLGLLTEAETLLLQAMQILEKAKATKSKAYILVIDNLLCVYLHYFRNVENVQHKALPLLTTYAQLAEEKTGKESHTYAKGIHNLSIANRILGQYSSAEILSRQAISVYEKTVGKHHRDYTHCLENLGDIYRYLFRHTQAIEVYTRCLSIIDEMSGDRHPDYTNVLYALYVSQIVLGQLADAEATGIQVSKRLIGELYTFSATLSDQEREALHRGTINHLLWFNTFAQQRYKSNPAISTEQYNNQLAVKAFLLHASKKVKHQIVNSQDTLLINMYNQWTKQRELLARYYRFSKSQLAAHSINPDSLQKKINMLEKNLTSYSGNFAQMHDRQLYTWKDIQQVLQKGEAALEMVRYREFDFTYTGKYTDNIYYAALIVTPESTYPQVVLLENGNTMEEAFLKAYRADILHRTQESDSYSHYWQPIVKALAGVKKLYFSPDGVYHQLNLNTLYNRHTGKYLLDELDIVLVTSTKDLLQKSQAKEVHNKVKPNLLIGYPDYDLQQERYEQLVINAHKLSRRDSYSQVKLHRSFTLQTLPGTKKEVELVGHLLQKNKYTVSLHLAEQALEEVIKNTVSPRVLHIATHGYFEQNTHQDKNDQNPLLRSGLLLAGAKQALHDTATADYLQSQYLEDGILTAYEAMNLSLEGTELVVLSACETGLGEIKNGEGVYGLQRAFKVAGAESLLMSLWKVDDKTTQELMSRFYKGWLQGKSKTAAFKQAQKKLRKSYKDPYYWAAFVLVGE